MSTTTSAPNRSSQPLEDLQDEIATLSALIQAATCRLLLLIGELDRRGGWADPLDSGGFRSCAHWLNWRTGLGFGAARQYVRVARALPGVPRITAAFRQGEISYSKVRAITRIATPDTEEMLLGWARAGTAAHVEKLVRAYRRANRQQENDRALAQQQARGLTTWFDDEGMLVVRGRLTPEQGALLCKALEVAADDSRAQADDSAEPSVANEGPARAAGQPRGDQRRADALARVAERALATSAAEAPAAAADRFHVVVHVDAEVLADPRADGRCELEDGPALAADTVRRLACDATVSALVHGPRGELTPGRKRRLLTAPLRRALKARDGTRCAFPGCGCRALDAHHVRAWAEGGPTELANMIGMCRRHHVLVHEGGFRVEASAEGGFRFLTPAGREVQQAPPAPALPADPARELAERWVPADARFTPDSGLPTWMGERFDYGWAIESLMVRSGAGGTG